MAGVAGHLQHTALGGATSEAASHPQRKVTVPVNMHVATTEAATVTVTVTLPLFLPPALPLTLPPLTPLLLLPQHGQASEP